MVQSLSEGLAALGRVWKPLLWMTPLNLDDLDRELSSTLQDPSHTKARMNPVYREIDLPRVTEHLDLIPPLIKSAPESLQTVLEQDVSSRLELLTALRDRNDIGLSSWARDHTGLPSSETMLEALETLQGASSIPSEEAAVSTGELIERIQTALDGYHLTNWKVAVQPAMAAKASVTGSRNLISVKEGTFVSEAEAKRLIVHEIGGHVLRWCRPSRCLTMAASCLVTTGG